MIPQVIHYCWFGGKPLPKRLLRYQDSWRRMMPDAQIVRWDESNFDVKAISYVQDAYRAGKWAFVSDYARLDVIFRHGGIYLDTDVELVRSLVPLLGEKAFCARENPRQVNTGLVLAAEKGNPLIAEMRDAYRSYVFPSPACTVLQTDILNDHGLRPSADVQRLDGLTVYPQEYFNPMDAFGVAHPTERTFSIHHAEASWMAPKWRLMKRLRRLTEGVLPSSLVPALVRFKRFAFGPYSTPEEV